MKKSILFGLFSLAFSATALAQVQVDDAWVRGTVPQQKATGAFMRLTADKPARLVAAESPVAGVTQIHEMSMQDNVMKMQEIPGLDLPAGKAVELKPGGYHVMLMNLHGQVKGGDVVPITLTFEDPETKTRFTQTVEAKAAALGAPSAPPMDGAMQHGSDMKMEHKH